MALVAAAPAAASGSSGAGSSGAARGARRPARGSSRPDVEWADAEAQPPALDATFVGAKIAFHFPEHGWVEGVVIETNDDPEEVDEDQEMMANFIVEYDDGDVPHFLVVDGYSTLIDAPEGSWYVVGGQE